MSYNDFSVRYNIMDISSLREFLNIKGGINNNRKDVYFIRVVGVNSTFFEDIENADKSFTKMSLDGVCKYNRVKELPKIVFPEDIEYYSKLYNDWVKGGRKRIDVKASKNNNVGEMLNYACNTVLSLFKNCSVNCNEFIEKNFMVKLLYQFDKIWEANFSENWNLKLSVKFIVENVLKRQEYFLCYLLTLMGIDVCLLQYKKDLPDELIKLNLSKEIVLGPFSDKNTSIYSPEKYIDSEGKKEITQETHMNKNVSKSPVLISYHKQSNKKNNLKEDNIKNSEPLEKNFEELALLASSVVMISIHDDREEIIGTGSGIMIGEKGYILTNNHVASGGRFYSVRIEDDSETYFTDEVIKYNTVFDLAIIRIDRKLNPLPVYSGQKKLVRGQKVVAIGSPLGLFNSVSDGIISGFRNIDGVDMIQFTAPISHGSSGGAVLNMFGEVIGISTAGFDNGQNINLAVGYEFINNFKRGF